jgi:hypothetical protein
MERCVRPPLSPSLSPLFSLITLCFTRASPASRLGLGGCCVSVSVSVGVWGVSEGFCALACLLWKKRERNVNGERAGSRYPLWLLWHCTLSRFPYSCSLFPVWPPCSGRRKSEPVTPREGPRSQAGADETFSGECNMIWRKWRQT